MPVKYWEIIADNLSKAGWSLGWVSATDLEGRTLWVVDAHGYGKLFIVHADEKLTAFVEMETAIHAFAATLCAAYKARYYKVLREFCRKNRGSSPMDSDSVR